MRRPINESFNHKSKMIDSHKIDTMITELGIESYGIYWLIVEKLCLYGDYMMPYSAIPNLARKYSTPPEKITKIVKDYDLFILLKDSFYHEDIKKEMEKKEYINQTRQQAGVKSGESRRNKMETLLKRKSA